jgi:uracil-DNA glycosylase family 4
VSDPRSEARAVVASARAWLEELSEEGVEALDLPALDPTVAKVPENAAAEAIESAQPEVAPSVAQPSRSMEAPSPTTAATAPLAAPDLGSSPTLTSVREALGECTRCKLSEKRQQIVFGDGNPDADLMFVGEGPGADEDAQGIPFVGRAGQLLTDMIEKGLQISRQDIYICNIVKCRPPQNRTPLPDEVESCRPFLEGQIAAVRPKVIVALGKPATSLLLGRDVSITRTRGQWHEFQGIPLMPTLHPAYVLRQYTEENRRNVWDDLKQALERSRTS